MKQEPATWIYMVGGGSHKANARLARDLMIYGLRAKYAGPYFPKPGSKGFYTTKKVVYLVHADDVQRAQSLGMTVMKNPPSTGGGL